MLTLIFERLGVSISISISISRASPILAPLYNKSSRPFPDGIALQVAFAENLYPPALGVVHQISYQVFKGCIGLLPVCAPMMSQSRPGSSSILIGPRRGSAETNFVPTPTSFR